MSAFLTEMWSWYVLTWFITITRMISRMLLLRSIRKFQVEDFLALVAMLTDTVIMIGMSILSRTNTNLFDPKQNIILTPEEISNRILGSKMIVLVESMQCATIWLMKCCLLIMYYRLTTSLKQNLAVKIVGGYVVFGFVLMMVLYLSVWCRPISGYWAVPQANPECNASPSHLKLNAVLNISSDLMIISIPMPLLIRSKLPPKRKAVLCGVFALGTFTILCAILSKVYSFREPYSDRWTFWYVRESSTAIITANLPYVWTLLRRIFNLKAFNESSQRSTSKPTTANLRSALSRTHRSGDPQSLRISRSDSQEQINMSYSVPLKIYQRHQVEITSEEVFGNDTGRSAREFEYKGGLKTTAVAGKDNEFERRSGNEETASERSGNESINAFQGV